MALPPMRGMQMPGLSMQEMTNLPPSQGMPEPEYTVTSPPMSPPMSPPPPSIPSSAPGKEMNHQVKNAGDYKTQDTETAETTVLLKVKEGEEYKLVLNMQQFTPEDITIKLNGQELVIEAAIGGEGPLQVVPCQRGSATPLCFTKVPLSQ